MAEAEASAAAADALTAAAEVVVGDWSAAALAEVLAAAAVGVLETVAVPCGFGN